MNHEQACWQQVAAGLNRREGQCLGVNVLPKLPKDATDRNRTSPFAFTGNKFEFRMVGSSQSVSGPTFVLNTIVADALSNFADRLEKAKDVNAEAAKIIRDTIVKHERIIFNGDGYADAWVKEAKRRGLLNLATTPDAVPHYSSKKNIDLFKRQGVLFPEEVRAREELKLEGYVATLNIEALAMIEIAKRDIIPAVLEYSANVANTISSLKGQRVSTAVPTTLLKALTSQTDTLGANVKKLENAIVKTGDWDAEKTAKYYGKEVVSAMAALRASVDSLETLVDRNYWPMPSYGEVLLSVK
jgi:glutamine synthetase